MKTIARFVGCLLLCSGVFCGRAENEPQKQVTTPKPLFQHIRLAKPLAQSDLRGMLEYQPVSIRWETLYELQPGSRVELNLLRNVRLIAYIEQVERRGERSVSCFGRLDGIPGEYSDVILTNEGEVLLASIYCPPLDISYGVRYHRDGFHLAYRVDPTEHGECATGQEAIQIPTDSEAEGNPDLPSDFLPAGDFSTSACVQPTATLDIMVVYTPAVRTNHGSHNAVRALAQLGVDVSNTIYQNSQIPLRARLVHFAEVNYDESNDNFWTHLYRLTNNGDGFMDIVHTWRDQYRADEVVLFVNDDDRNGIWIVCGMATCSVTPEGAFSVVNAITDGCIQISSSTFTHEIGHNQGCAHNRAVAGGCARYSYSYGYRFTGTDSRRYRTVMAYGHGGHDCTGPDDGRRIPYFSDPNITYLGVAIGRPEGDSCAADNARTVRETARLRETFRLLDIWVDFGYPGWPLPEWGSFTAPFNTIAEGVIAITEYPTLVIPTLYIKAGSTNERPTIARRMRIQACGGTVRIGAP